jgi:hypothetical protein
MSSGTTFQHELATIFHRALTAKDWPLLRQIMAPNVTWTLPGDKAISGTAIGINEVITRAELIASYGIHSALEHVLVSRDNMALRLHNTARRGELVLDEHLATVRTLSDGRIVTIETYLFDLDGMNAFFAGDLDLLTTPAVRVQPVARPRMTAPISRLSRGSNSTTA